MKGAQDICLFSAMIKTEIKIEVKVEETEPPPIDSVEKENFDKEYLDTGLQNNLTEQEMLSKKNTFSLAEKPSKCNQCSTCHT